MPVPVLVAVPVAVPALVAVDDDGMCVSRSPAPITS